MPGTGRFGVGLIGAGNISDQYLTHLTSFPDIEVLIVGDLDEPRAAEQAAKYGVPCSGSAQDVLDHPGVELVVNLTIPAVHAAVSSQILAAGKHVWTEKPLSVDRESGRRVLAEAAALGLRVGVAPDTVLGPGFQTAKRAIERGDIGTPLSAQTQFMWQGPDTFHPNPSFLFAKGGGPLFDMGPYYVTALVSLFGSVDAVAAIGSKAQQTRLVQQGPSTGTPFPVEVPTLVDALMQYEGGGVSQSLYSFDSPLFRHGIVEITGTEGTIVLPDPNRFAGDISIIRPLTELRVFPVVQKPEPVEQVGAEAGRGLGVLNMARSIRAGVPHVATGEIGYHVLDTLIAIEESIAARQFVTVESAIEPVGTIAADFDPYARTL